MLRFVLLVPLQLAVLLLLALLVPVVSAAAPGRRRMRPPPRLARRSVIESRGKQALPPRCSEERLQLSQLADVSLCVRPRHRLHAVHDPHAPPSETHELP
jgi:hypothetical protein